MSDEKLLYVQPALPLIENPIGFTHSAQGCEERATLGTTQFMFPALKRLNHIQSTFCASGGKSASKSGILILLNFSFQRDSKAFKAIQSIFETIFFYFAAGTSGDSRVVAVRED